jgi:2-polyprenyl-3-methyl-5-hydroxy-6-metoxy-1,4-benzoquinol methylase
MPMGRQSEEQEDDDHFRFRRCLAFLQDKGAEIQPGASWLDLGCNQGQFLRMVSRLHGVRGIGCDDWDPRLKTAGTDDAWDYFQADLNRELPWSGRASFISALEVIEHVVDTDGFLKRALAVLEPGGWIVISTPNINSLRNRIAVPLGRYPVGPEHRTVIHHVRIYNVEKLREQLLSTGFADVSLRGVSFFPMSSGLGRSGPSTRLADAFPSFCSNLIAIARKPNKDDDDHVMRAGAGYKAEAITP